MIGIHTYVPSHNIETKFNRNLVYNMLLSTHLAKFSFDKVVLYTTKEIEKIVRKIGVPYDEIITEPFDGFKCKTFSIPKMVTYSLQTEPFAHLDLDTFIYALPKKIDKEPVFYASSDIPLKKENNFKTNMSMYNTYLKGTFEIEDKLPDEFKKHIDFFDIPNMCIFGGNDYETIKKASEYCLKIYEENKEHFDSNYYYACVIEQLFISTAIKMINKENEIVDEDVVKEEEETFYLFSQQQNLSIDHETSDLVNITYPFTISFNNKKKIINNETELYTLANYDFNWIIHLCGNKSLDAVLFIVRETIIQRFNGFNSIQKMNDIFGQISEVENISSRYYKFLKGNINIWENTRKTIL
jgi:hypothetical protein